MAERRTQAPIASISGSGVGWVAIGFALACLLAFWVSMLIPRADGSLLGSDGTHYYAYLPSVILDGDLDFTNDYAVLLRGEPEKLERYTTMLTPTGRPVNVWSIGPALLWAPFFLAMHGLMLGLSTLGLAVPADGYSMPYQAAALTGSIVYGGIGLALVGRATIRAIPDARAVGAGIVAVAAAGNLIYYMTVEPHMSHAVSVFAAGLFFYTWLAGRHDTGVRRAVALGAIAGLLALIRPQDGLLLVLPYLDRVLLDRAEGITTNLRRLLRDGLVSGLVALAVFSPQLVVWHLLWGTFLASPYSLQGEQFSWFGPRGIAVLFSGHRGLFVWHPVFLLATLGLLVHLRRDEALATAALVGLAIQWYLISSWWAWDQGKSFGGRMFITCTPLFVLGAAALFQHARERGRERVAIGVGAMLLVANLVFIPLYVATW